jgi:hypothetical protein
VSSIATGGASATGGSAGKGGRFGESGGSDTGGSTSGGSSNGGSTNGGTGGGGTGGTNGCFAIQVKADAVGVDMYVMFDQSNSMVTSVPSSNPPTTWWTAAQQAFQAFVQDPAAVGMGVGIQFFPYKGSVAGADPNVPGSSCYVPNYETPEVEIGLLPGNAAALVGAVGAHTPTTFTPTAPALQGAVLHMQKWGAAHPGRQAAVVLVTDGFPTECDPQDPSLIAQIAQAAYEGSPQVLTYVIGLEDAGSLTNLTTIARAGGTGPALLIAGSDISPQLVQALLSVTRSPFCQISLPPATPGSPLDVSQLWMQFEPPPSGAPEVIPRVSALADCAASGGGWYFDSPSTPTKMITCPETCRRFAAANVSIMYGCKPTSP